MVRAGIVAEIVGIAALGLVISPTSSWLAVVPCLFVYGFGVGLATAQLTGVVLVDVPVQRSGEGSGLVPEAAAAGLDTLLTGEPAHKHFHDAFEYGVNVIYAGHYETEVFGVRALAAKIEDEFGVPWQFLNFPTGL